MLLFLQELRAYSTDKYKPRPSENIYQNLKKETPADAYSLINNSNLAGTTSDIKRNLNKFRETNDYIQQKYDFADAGHRNEEENMEKTKIEQLISVFIFFLFIYLFLLKIK